jgi:hypothetical protein
MHLANEHRFDLLASAGKQPADGRTDVGNLRALGVKSRSLLAGLVVLAGLAVPWPQAQPAGAVAQAGGSITADKTAPIANPPEGHTGVIVPPANAPRAPDRCPARTGAVAQEGGTITAHRTAPSIATPPEGHTGVIVPPASDPSARCRAPTGAVARRHRAPASEPRGASDPSKARSCSGNDLYVCATSEPRRTSQERA